MSYWKRTLLGLVVLDIFLIIFKYIPPSISKDLSSFFLPGYETVRINHVNPILQEKLQRIFYQLQKKGYQPKIYLGYRAAEMQDFLYQIGQSAIEGGKSCHNYTRKGAPSSDAVDVWGEPYGLLLFLGWDWSIESHAQFFISLGQLAKEEELVWGGDWTKKTSVWTEYGLGSQPSHIQLPSCL